MIISGLLTPSAPASGGAQQIIPGQAKAAPAGTAADIGATPWAEAATLAAFSSFLTPELPEGALSLPAELASEVLDEESLAALDAAVLGQALMAENALPAEPEPWAAEAEGGDLSSRISAAGLAEPEGEGTAGGARVRAALQHPAPAGSASDLPVAADQVLAEPGASFDPRGTQGPVAKSAAPQMAAAQPGPAEAVAEPFVAEALLTEAEMPGAGGALPRSEGTELRSLAEPGPARRAPASPLTANVFERLQEIEQSEGRTRVILRPQGLGLLEIDVTRLADGRLHMAIRAENPMVLQSLEQEAGALKEFLDARGFDFSGGGPDLGRFTRPETGAERGEPGNATGLAEADLSETPVHPGRMGQGQLDILT